MLSLKRSCCCGEKGYVTETKEDVSDAVVKDELLRWRRRIL